MSHVFLSYAREDLEAAKRLARALEAHGLAVWWDRTIPPGKTFDQVIEEALADAEKVVVLWSARSVTSNWVRAEADEALERGILVPVLIEDVLPPFSSRRIEAAELQRWTGDPNDPELQNLIAALRGTGYVRVRPEDPEPAPEPERPPAPTAPPPGPPPQPARRSRRGLKVALEVAVILAVLGIGLVLVVVMATQGMRQAQDGPPFDPEAVEPIGYDKPYADPSAVTVDDAPPVVTAAPTATVTFHYPPDSYGCEVNVNIEIGPHRFAFPTATGYALSDLQEGPTPYGVDGVIGCPGIGVCTAQGSGMVAVYDGAAFDLIWENTAYAYCQATLQEQSTY
jgi:hypothetical protein